MLRSLALLLCVSYPGTSADFANSDHPVRRIVRNAIGDFPMAELNPYVGDQSAALSVVSLLCDAKQGTYWPQAVLSLGYIAPYNPKLVDSLVDFLQGPGPFQFENRCAITGAPRIVSGRSAALARMQVPVALGDQLRKQPAPPVAGSGLRVVARAAPDPEPFVESHVNIREYLEKGISPAVWKERIHWLAPNGSPTDGERDEELAVMSVKGLSLACTEGSRAAFARALQSSQAPLVNEALDAALLRCK